MLIGLATSFAHDQNGMTLQDMESVKQVANRHNEVIIFRSAGPWSKRWLEQGYPSKNFHVKGKSSDWGPHAGLVPYDGTWSKVGYDAEKAAKGTKANNDGLASGFAGKEPLVLNAAMLDLQLTRGEGRTKRSAIESKLPCKNGDLLLTCRRSGDNRRIVFRAIPLAERGNYEIRVYVPEGTGAMPAFTIADRDPKGELAQVFEVMTSNEANAGKPMTGDYDLFAVCPSYGAYGNRAPGAIEKPGIRLANGVTHPGLRFEPGHGMDKVLDVRLHTSSRGGDFHLRRDAAMAKGVMTKAQTEVYGDHGSKEHADMGNLTPRILRCINELNVTMGAVDDKAALRRVHHNAESHRNRRFGALTAKDMVTKKDGDDYGDGFPLTVFQPEVLRRSGSAVSSYGDVSTLESLFEFKEYVKKLNQAGYYVPQNWIW